MPNTNIPLLAQIVQIDETKCVNCHACISACPVKYCNDGSKEYVTLNSQLCIGCGSCVDACTHKARYFKDDFDVFRDSIINNEKIIVLISPAVAANFEGKILQINGFFSKLGADAIFDVSFGAELSAKSYIEYIKKTNPQTVITQPCPALVSYIEIYQPELLPYLAPVHSPVGHTVELIKNYYTQYKNHKIAFISPCVAKKREFEETGLVDFNVGITSIARFIEENNILLSDMPEVDFANPSAERAVLFSSPGGLLETVKRTIPEIGDVTRKIEGVPLVYNYFGQLNNSIKQQTSPLLIDCLSCENGCNGGPLTKMRHENADIIEYHVKKRGAELKKLYQSENEKTDNSVPAIEKIISKFWKEELYTRDYIDRSSTLTIKTPNEEELSAIFRSMHKFKDEDIKNCTSCGYNSCEGMAKAIFNGLNRPENCHFYLEKEAEKLHEETRKSKIKLLKMLETMPVGFLELDNEETLVDINPKMLQILNTDNVLGRKLVDFVADDYIPVLREQLKLRETGKKSSYELVLKQANGDKVWCSVHASPLYDSQNKKIGSFAMLADITALKNTEESLRILNLELENRVIEKTQNLSEAFEELRVNAEILESLNTELENLSLAVSQISNSIAIFDQNYETEWVNEMFLKNYCLENTYYSQTFNLNQIDFFSEIDQIVENIIKNQKPFTFTKRQSHKHGNSFTQTTISPIFGNDKKISKFIAVGTDITELKLAQEAISQQNEEIKQQKEELTTQRDALAESEDKINNILSSLPDPAFVINEKGIITFWNNAIENLTGLAASQMIGKGNNEYAIPFYGKRRLILIDLVNIDSSILEQNYSQIERKGKILRAETYVPNLRGESRYLAGTATPLYSSTGEYIGAVEIIHDITERKRFIEEIEKQKSELVEQSVKMAEMIEELNVTNSIVESINKDLEQLSIVASETDNAVIIMDSAGNVDWVNRAFTSIYGRSLDELMAKKGKNICDFSEYENICEILNKVKSTKLSTTYNNKTTKPNGANLYVQTSLSPVLSPEGEITNLVAVEANITALQEAQEKILFQKEEIEKRKEEVEKQSKNIVDSIQYAGRIQKALLPPEAGIKNFMPEHFILFLPRDIVSGDFYWIHQINSKIIVVAADCTGHGVPGAFMSMLGISYLNEIVIKNKTTQANIILDKLRFNVKKALHQTGHRDTSQDGMDIALAVFDKETHTFEFSGAYNSLLQISNNEIFTFKGDKMPIGIHRRDTEPFTLTKKNYTKDDVFYLFSDGFPDQIGETTGRKYLHKNFMDFILKIYKKPMEQQKDQLFDEFFNWKKQYFQVDDVLVIGFKIE